jgi:predicted dehydrogenase
MKAFAEALQAGEKMPVGARDGLMSIVLGLAATLSAREKRPVAVSEILG